MPDVPVLVASDDPTARIVLNRPDKKNALNNALLQAKACCVPNRPDGSPSGAVDRATCVQECLTKVGVAWHAGGEMTEVSTLVVQGQHC